MIRTPFGEVAGLAVELRRISYEDAEAANCSQMDTPIGIFQRGYGLSQSRKLLAVVELNDLFDNTGMRFIND